MSDQVEFNGFVEPKQNWSKLPHALIEALPLIETAGEMKVILYVLRHTWGYHDSEKKITADEFMHGRKRRDGSRLDNGTGMSKPTVIDGLRRAETHGFITIEVDDSDQGRVKKLYSLRMSESKNFTPEVKEPDTRGQESLHRTEKDTSERNTRESGNTPLADDPIEDQYRAEIQEAEQSSSGHAALDIYIEETGEKLPSRSWCQAVEQAVSDVPNGLALWRRTIHAWIGMGWRKNNLVGMLECFTEGRIPGEDRNGNGHHGGNGGTNGTATAPAPPVKTVFKGINDTPEWLGGPLLSEQAA